MAYLGKSPTEIFRAFSVKDTFTGDGSTLVFTLSRAAFVGSPNDVQVFVDNVRQEPGSGKSYTIEIDGSSNATQLTFTAAPPAASEIYVIISAEPTTVVVPADGSVTTAKVADGAITSAKIADGTVIAADVGDGTITGAKLATNIDITSTGSLSFDGGTIKLDGNYPVGTNNTALGNGALDDGSLTGSWNTAIGNSALSSNTTGGYNVAISRALVSNTTGVGNIGIGWSSLYANTTNYNVGVGYATLASTTTGANNIAIGRSALCSNTTSSNNVAVGYEALCTNTTGSTNTASGTCSMRSNTTGTQNSAYGFCALYSNTTGNSNTAIGREALKLNTADNNTAVGYASLCANTTGASNTAVGYTALCANTTGGSNTAVGYVSQKSITTGNSNTSLGYETMCVGTTASVNVAIGYRSMRDVSTGCYNTAINQALPLISTGCYNTAVGYLAGFSISTGNNNLLLGNDAGRATSPSGNLTTQSNIAVYGDNNMTDHYMAGDLRLTTGGLYVGGSADANKLDDYEEGTWTPEITPATGSFTAITYSNREGHYTKIGNIVYFTMFLRTASSSNFSGASGVISITGLPFSASSTPIVRAGGSFFTAFDRWNSNSILDTSIIISTSITPSSSSIGLGSIITSSGDAQEFSVSNLRDVSATDNRIGLSGFYMTDA